MTRIVGGVAGGRRIAVSARGTRPTTDRVREALFNILSARLEFTGITVLDLYAGSGALGLEALSRGATSATFVESDRKAAAVLERNIATLGLPGAVVRRGQVSTVLTSTGSGPFDVVLADPPYDLAGDEVSAVLAALPANGWVCAGSVAVVERAAGSAALEWPHGWQLWQHRVYGDTRLELAERR